MLEAPAFVAGFDDVAMVGETVEQGRHGYSVRALAEQFSAKPAEIRQFLRGMRRLDNLVDLTNPKKTLIFLRRLRL